ncbi:MAG TPA: MarC family protein [Chthoniobacter sp.]|jgi:multiple antibiotic resistance protein
MRSWALALKFNSVIAIFIIPSAASSRAQNCANTPIFINLTESEDAATKRAVAVRSLLVAFGIIVVVSLAGNLLFKLFGISLATLRISGGIVVFIIGYHMLQGTGAHAHKPSDADIADSKEAQLSVAVSPLGIPMLAGPGTIATAMNFAAGDWMHTAISLGSFAIICGATYVCFVYSDRLVAFLGQNGMNVMTRLMGLVVASIGVSMLLAGLGYSPRT